MGDGGGVVSKNENYINQIKMSCDHGRTDKYLHEFIGWNMRLDAIQANIMNKLISHIDEFNKMRRSIAKIYDENLKLDTFVKTKIYCENSYYQYTIRVKNRDKIISELKNIGINTGVQWPISLHQQPAIKSNIKLPKAEKIQSEILSIPCYPYLREDEISYVIDNINKII
jgi:UDP-2-acetamido-2-deoxy-ribo-hexuluronate aminotransferase